MHKENVAQKLLTIAVPTYNRADCLDLCLSQICKQLKGREEAVELIISNNCSTDATDQVVRKYLNAGAELSYLKNAENIGADGNFCQCFNVARGKYFLLFADDDVLLDGALEKILRALEDDFGVVHLKSYSFVHDYLAERPRQPSDQKICYDDTSQFIAKVEVMLTFISGNIVNKSLVDADLDCADFKETNLVQLSWTLSALLNSKRNMYIDSFILAAKAENTGGYRLCTVFGVNMNKIFDIFVARGVDRRYFEIINRKILRSFFPKYLLAFRKDVGEFQQEDYFKTLYPVFKGYPGFWLMVYPAIKFPLLLAKLWLKVCKNFFKILAPRRRRSSYRRENGWMLYLIKKVRAPRGRLYNYFLSKKLGGGRLNIHPSAQLFGLDWMTIGKNFMAGEHLRLEAVSAYGPSRFTPRIVIKDNVCLNDFVHIGAVNYVEIGNNVLMASKIYISDHNHGVYNGMDQSSPDTPPGMRVITGDQQVIIGDNVWIGEFVSILPGVSIGAGSIIGANSVVSKSIPPFSIAVGAPARVVKQYDPELKCWVAV